jgi:Bacterial tandem repeat domain 1
MPSAYYTAIFEQRSSGPAWAARWGLSSAEFQQTLDQFVGQGYQPVNVSGYGVGQAYYYAAIFEQRSSGPAWAARWGLSSAEFQQTLDQFVGQGYQPVNVSGYGVGQAYYAAIFEQRSSGPAWAARWGLSSAEFQQTLDQFVGQGYQPVNMSGYGVGQAYYYPYYTFGQAYYAAIFEQRSSGPAWAARWSLSSAEFQQTLDQFVGQGYQPVNVSGYGVGQAYYAAIFEQRSSGPAWAARWGLSSAEFQQTLDQFVGQGYQPVNMSGYGV